MKIYFLGILGISQSGLAEILSKTNMFFLNIKSKNRNLKTESNQVFGSDRTDNEQLRVYLENLGIKVFIGHDKKNIELVNPDLVVYNGAIASDNEELTWAKQNNIKTITRATCLGKIASHFKQVVAISGSHGKTTTTALTYATVLSLNPTTHCGGEIIIKTKYKTQDKECEIGRNNANVNYAILNQPVTNCSGSLLLNKEVNQSGLPKAVTKHNARLLPNKKADYSILNKSAINCSSPLFLNNEANESGLLSKAGFKQGKKDEKKNKTQNAIKLASKATIIGNNKNIFITEACEFKASFLKIRPDVSVVLNIDADHLDFYKNLNNVKSAFLKFVRNLKQDGTLIYNLDDKNSEILKNFEIKDHKSFINKISFGFSNKADFTPHYIRQNKNGTSFKIKTNNNLKAENIYPNLKNIRFYIKAFGRHNVINALVAIIVALVYKISPEKIKTNLKKFIGVKRRMEVVQNNLKLNIIHDYAHHPAEIVQTIKTAKQHFKTPVVVIFQPHTYTRTKCLWNEHLTCFLKADKTILLPIYSAREKPIKNITSQNLAGKIKNCSFAKNFKEAKNMAINFAKNNNATILILGAGDIVQMTSMF